MWHFDCIHFTDWCGVYCDESGTEEHMDQTNKYIQTNIAASLPVSPLAQAKKDSKWRSNCTGEYFHVIHVEKQICCWVTILYCMACWTSIIHHYAHFRNKNNHLWLLPCFWCTYNLPFLHMKPLFSGKDRKNKIIIICLANLSGGGIHWPHP